MTSSETHRAAPVLVEVADGVLTITINRPESRNAIDRATSEAIAAAVHRLDETDGISVGILTGAGGHFSAGMDLKAFAAGERVELEVGGLAGLVKATPRKPLIAAIEGYALAGGFEIALACDLIVASTSARFGLPEVRRGLIAGSGGLLRLPQRIPPQIAKELVLTGRMFNAPEAERWGLVNRLSGPGRALAEALDLAATIRANGPLAVMTSKHILDKRGDWPADTVWQRQDALLEDVLNSADAREGARAFGEKRPPVWSGR
ncbi:enoyl-CoA hydratase [Zhengella mangrovi]|uniref:Enoyl-CoA hydratase n=1 Tax=Zhengella mangrovi TaxID=1982044 RepID=A0A2G1QH00_9HYPH|nr:crotonase/enoyl-CoA hydratase family protein [Zhengella mangrovi]PHP64741.1 enoyl-CoA hydratase [Zhengella mangrovi]